MNIKYVKFSYEKIHKMVVPDGNRAEKQPNFEPLKLKFRHHNDKCQLPTWTEFPGTLAFSPDSMLMV